MGSVPFTLERVGVLPSGQAPVRSRGRRRHPYPKTQAVAVLWKSGDRPEPASHQRAWAAVSLPAISTTTAISTRSSRATAAQPSRPSRSAMAEWSRRSASESSRGQSDRHDSGGRGSGEHRCRSPVEHHEAARVAGHLYAAGRHSRALECKSIAATSPPTQRLKGRRFHADTTSMFMTNNLTGLVAVLLAGVFVTLYIMRRRSRLGRRTPKF